MSKGSKAACYRAVVEELKKSPKPVTLDELSDKTNYSVRMVRAQIRRLESAIAGLVKLEEDNKIAIQAAKALLNEDLALSHTDIAKRLS